jgi:hypothetical protein
LRFAKICTEHKQAAVINESNPCTHTWRKSIGALPHSPAHNQLQLVSACCCSCLLIIFSQHHQTDANTTHTCNTSLACTLLFLMLPPL